MRFPAKITSSCIWVAIPVGWVILHWYACGADGRSVGRTVTWLSKFLEWADLQITKLSYPWCSASRDARAWSSAMTQMWRRYFHGDSLYEKSKRFWPFIAKIKIHFCTYSGRKGLYLTGKKMTGREWVTGGLLNRTSMITIHSNVRNQGTCTVMCFFHHSSPLMTMRI